jgi:hypothetical protein
VLTVGGSQPDDEDDMEDYQSPDEEYSVSNEDGIAKIEKQTSQERTRIQLDISKANNQAGITSVAELLKIGTEKGAGSTLSTKEAEDIFNSEAAEEHEDDEALAALEELNENQERKVEKIGHALLPVWLSCRGLAAAVQTQRRRCEGGNLERNPRHRARSKRRRRVALTVTTNSTIVCFVCMCVCWMTNACLVRWCWRDETSSHFSNKCLTRCRQTRMLQARTCSPARVHRR